MDLRTTKKHGGNPASSTQIHSTRDNRLVSALNQGVSLGNTRLTTVMNNLSHPARLRDLSGVVRLQHANTTIAHELRNAKVCLLSAVSPGGVDIPKTGI